MHGGARTGSAGLGEGNEGVECELAMHGGARTDSAGEGG